MSKTTKRERVTAWHPPMELFKSEYGVVSFEEWCQHEKVRMERISGATIDMAYAVKQGRQMLSLVRR